MERVLRTVSLGVIMVMLSGTAASAGPGSQKWSYTAGDMIYWSSPAVAGGHTVYIGSHDNKLYALNKTDGIKK